ncbi:cysteine dioxygenase [Streptomyces sannanensis]|uniref:cysteine dioxygenase n=1 Tax=Streptomyces sannanensis TaxID=285536 RepID=UPI003CD0AF5A
MRTVPQALGSSPKLSAPPPSSRLLPQALGFSPKLSASPPSSRLLPQALGFSPKLSASLEQGGPPRAGETPLGYEVWLLSWVPGQGSGLHDHGRSSGVLTVLEGELTERTERGTRTLNAGSQRVFAPGYVHEVLNDTLEPAVSLHIYYPGLTQMPMYSAQCAPAERMAVRT